MSKRSIGEKAKVLFDSIDLEILSLLASFEKAPKGLQVLELADKLKIKHKNLKPHIDKLRQLGLIRVLKIKNSQGSIEIRLISPTVWYRDIKKSLTLGEMELLEKEIELEVDAYTLLSGAEEYYRNKESDKLIDLDLRRTKTIKNEQQTFKKS